MKKELEPVKIFEESHRSHMSEDYSQYKMVKGEEYFKPDVKKFLS